MVVSAFQVLLSKKKNTTTSFKTTDDSLTELYKDVGQLQKKVHLGTSSLEEYGCCLAEDDMGSEEKSSVKFSHHNNPFSLTCQANQLFASGGDLAHSTEQKLTKGNELLEFITKMQSSVQGSYSSISCLSHPLQAYLNKEKRRRDLLMFASGLKRGCTHT